jgi:hypothetical protein
MVGISIRGRLGNQMFQYAFIRALGIHSNNLFFVCCPHDKFLLNRYFNLGGSIQYGLALTAGRVINFLVAKTGLKVKAQSFSLLESQPDLDNLSNFTIYHGFFQTNKYYSQFADRLNNEFRIRKKYRNSFKAKYPVINKEKVLVLHLRRGDYKQFYIEDLNDQDFRLPLNYYLKCLDRLDDLDTYRVYIIGDEIDVGENKLPCEVSIEKNDMIVDFQLMMAADTLIISNSTFAWWAAMLNKKENKVVYAPKYWVGFKQKLEYPKEIMMPDWHWIDV